MISFTNPFYSALALIGNLGSLAVLFLLASAEFVAAAQVLVYAGAVMVMFLFVIAYLGERAEPLPGGPSWVSRAAVVAAIALLVEIVVAIGLKAGDSLSDEAQIERSFGSAGGDRPALPDRPPARIRDHLDRVARRGGRRRRAGTRSLAEDEEEEQHVQGPNVAWYLVVRRCCSRSGRRGVLLRRSPLIVLLSLEIMLNGGEPRADLVRAPARRAMTDRSSPSR